jgi:hypothetical protein
MSRNQTQAAADDDAPAPKRKTSPLRIVATSGDNGPPECSHKRTQRVRIFTPAEGTRVCLDCGQAEIF